jgi:signal transduction histidine kinase
MGRRRIERDLHDGAQQRPRPHRHHSDVALRALDSADDEAVELVREALEHAERATAELRALAHGILPTALSRGWLARGASAHWSRAYGCR